MTTTAPKRYDSPGEAPGTAPPPGKLDRNLLAVALVVVLGMAMTGLDMTAVNVSLNRLSSDFSTSLATVQWVATAYTLALAAVIPVSAWAIGRFGTQRVFMASVVLFLGGSVLCGMAWSIESLIAFRVLQGLGGGMIMPVGMTIMTRRAGERMPQVMAIVGIPMQLAPMAGPLVGGWLVDAVSWRWIFYLNVPLAVFALVLAARVLGPDEPSPTRPLDVKGLLLLSPGLSALIFGLTTGAHHGDFGDVSAALPTAAGALLVAAFVRHALRTEHPLIDLRLLRERAVAMSATTLALFMCGFFGMMLLAPMYYQMVRGESATATGLLLVPSGLGTLVTMPLGARLIGRVGPRRILLTGLSLSVVGLGTFAVLVGAGASYWALGAALFATGGGMGMTMMPTMASAMQTLRPEAVPVASTLLNIVQQVGASAGTALISLVLANALAGRAAADAPGAFQVSYAVGIALLVVALVPASRVARAMAAGPQASVVHES
ncbi:DHA2 family efflux MFS transporter permease subunit [Streptodolium elevatio]|uniref:DHA2 family efflux MFS transporter permease subunit n=1 Tax=Streptodolium elevatio TaxID=3157996 RepID=A0ABV3D9F8_9ACTN